MDENIENSGEESYNDNSQLRSLSRQGDSSIHV